MRLVCCESGKGGKIVTCKVGEVRGQQHSKLGKAKGGL